MDETDVSQPKLTMIKAVSDGLREQFSFEIIATNSAGTGSRTINVLLYDCSKQILANVYTYTDVYALRGGYIPEVCLQATSSIEPVEEAFCAPYTIKLELEWDDLSSTAYTVDADPTTDDAMMTWLTDWS